MPALTGFSETLAATWPEATVQIWVVHLIRAAMRFLNYKDRKAIAVAHQEPGHLPTKPRASYWLAICDIED